MKLKNILYTAVLAAVIIFFFQDTVHAQRRRMFNTKAVTAAQQMAYKDYFEKTSFVHNAVKKASASPDEEAALFQDPEGIIFVSDILKYKNVRRHPVMITNDAEQLLIQAVESVRDKDYDKALDLTREAIKKDNTYLRAHFLLAGLYDRKGDIKNMANEYRYYLEKTLFMRKLVEEKTGWPDLESKFIKAKLNRYHVPFIEPTVKSFNIIYKIIGIICIVLVFGIGAIVLINIST